MADTNVILQSILETLNAITVRLNEKTVAQERSEQELENYKSRKNKTNLEKNVETVANSLKQSATGAITASERQRIEKTAKIYNQVYKLSDNYNILKNILSVLKEADTERDQEKLFTKSVSQPKPITAKTEKKPDTLSSILGSIGGKIIGSAGLLGLGLAVYHIVKSMVDFKSIDTKTIIAFGVVLTVLGASLWKFSSTVSKILKGTTILQSAIAIGAVAYTFNHEVVPGLKSLAGVKWDDIKEGLGAAGIALTGMLTLVGITKTFLTNSLSGGLTTAAALTAVYASSKILGVLADSMVKFAAFNWDQVSSGLKSAGVSLTSMLGLVGVVSAIFSSTGGIGALAAVVAEGVIWGAIELIGRTADVLKSFKGIDADHLAEVGKNLIPFTKGIVTFMTLGAVGAVANVVSAAVSWFKIGPVEQIRKFEDVKYDYMESLGKGLTALGQGIYNFFSIGGSIGSFIEGVKSWVGLDIVSQIKKYETIDSNRLASVGEAFGIFAGGLRELAIASNSIRGFNIDVGKLSKSIEPVKLNMEIRTLSDMKNELVELGKNELELMSQQILLLRENNLLLGKISESSRSGVSISSPVETSQPISINREKSVTKQTLFDMFRLEGGSIRE